MSGIIFFGTRQLTEIKRFYLNQVGCQIWIDQEGCIIFKNGNMLFGFCERNEAETGGIITFLYPTKEDVDNHYETFKKIAVSSPSMNEKYSIYHFFVRDPEERKVEFQCFTHPVERYLSGDELLLSRRSFREFKQMEIPEETLENIFDISRFSPTSHNSQSYYFKVIKNRELLDWISKTRDENSAPIGRAPAAVAICSDPERSKRYVEDGCIAAYHFMLTAWFFGLGTCWIAAMDREDVKKRLEIPEHHYIATITPLGYPENVSVNPPARKDLSWFLKK